MEIRALQYCPTPTEIRAKCLAIQSTWSEKERQRRMKQTNSTPAPPSVRLIRETDIPVPLALWRVFER